MVDTLWNVAIWALQNLLWNVLMAAIGAIAATTAVTKGFGYLKSRQSLIWFSASCFVLLLVGSFLTSQRVLNLPNLKGNIEAVYVAQSTPRTLVIVEAIKNSGSMPSAAYFFRVSLKHAGQVFDCTTTGLPEELNLILPARGSIPQRNITYYNKDSLALKVLSPVPIGGLISGILVCELNNLDIDSLKEADEVMVSFVDVFQNDHIATIQGSSKYVDAKIFPGLTQSIK